MHMILFVVTFRVLQMIGLCDNFIQLLITILYEKYYKTTENVSP